MIHPIFSQEHSSLFRNRNARSRRVSSWDRSGGNKDYVKIGPGETALLLEHDGPGCLTHIYVAMVVPDIADYRNGVLRCFWDGSEQPSVQVPLGDFFGVAHGRVREFQSSMVAVNGGLGGSSHGLNSYFPMPFADGVRVTLENRGDTDLGGALGNVWYHIDFETYDTPLPDDADRFHACYRQERPTVAVGPQQNLTLHDDVNLTGEENYVALEASGRGRMVGLVLEIENVHGTTWYGEGDDMVFIDGETWPPSIHGTGSEEIFGGGACPTDEYVGPYTGYHLIDSEDYDGLAGMYRWYVRDPIHFDRSLRWTIEHGHANNFANNYASVAYWYQQPVAGVPELPERDEMLPPLGPGYERARSALFELTSERRAAVGQGAAIIEYLRSCRAARPFYRGDWESTLTEVERYRNGGGG